MAYSHTWGWLKRGHIGIFTYTYMEFSVWEFEGAAQIVSGTLSTSHVDPRDISMNIHESNTSHLTLGRFLSGSDLPGTSQIVGPETNPRVQSRG